MHSLRRIRSCLALWISPLTVGAEGLRDRRVFSGSIGPTENPDLDDTLHFADGHCWSEICTRCGFMPGKYTAERISDGISFSRVLRRDDRGQFSCQCFVKANGEIRGDIARDWRRWYRTARRHIVFQGSAQASQRATEVPEIRERVRAISPDADPACARF